MQSGSKAASSEVLAILCGLMARRRNQWCTEVRVASDVEPASWWQLVLGKDAYCPLVSYMPLDNYDASTVSDVYLGIHRDTGAGLRG